MVQFANLPLLFSTFIVNVSSYYRFIAMQFLKGMGGFGASKPAAAPAKPNYFSSLKLE